MNKILFRKRIVIVIISLFICASLMPVINGLGLNLKVSKKNDKNENQELLL